MKSRLLATLNEQAEKTTDPVVWARTVCRAAAHYARHGMSPQALKAISVVRDHYGDNLNPEVASWLMLAEGVIHYFEVNTKDAYDRIRRAYGLAVALQNEPALPVCAAWMAVVEFHDGEYTQMSAHIEEALTTAKADDHPAHARASLVLANSYHFSGSYSLARPWYERTRIRSADDGDNATLSAMLYNVAAIRAANVRLDDTFGIESPAETHRAGMEIASSRHFDHAINSHGLGFLPLLLRGLIKTLSRNFDEALNLYREVEKSRLQPQMLSPMYVDIAWCLVNTGDIDGSIQYMQSAIDNTDHLFESDDRAYVNSRISQILRILNRSPESEKFELIAVAALNEHRTFQKSLLARLEAIRKK